MKSKVLASLLWLAVGAAPVLAQAPHTLQVDDGSGNVTTLSATAGSSSNYTFPPGSGMVMTNTNVSSYTWANNGNALTAATPSTPVEFLGSLNNADVVVKTYGTEQFRIQASGGIKLPTTTSTGSGVVYQGATPVMHTYGANNFFAGGNAGNLTMSGTDNLATGQSALSGNTTGTGNVANGSGAGAANLTGNNNTFIGRSANASAGNFTNATAIGANAIVGQDNSLVLGNNAAVGIGTSTPVEKLEVNGNVRISGLNGLKITEGTNATMGVTTLVGGTANVLTNKVTANSRIFLTIQNTNAGTPGATYVSARVVGNSFTITSTGGATDVSDVAWVIIEP
jgi:hypothetical protein